MRLSSPPVAIYKTPLKGMDAREVKPQDAPNLLFNVDLSNRGYWKERPGVKKFYDSGSTANKTMGVYATRVDGSYIVIAIFADTLNKELELVVLNGNGTSLYGPLSLTNTTAGTGSSYYDDRNYFSFITAGKYVYFCNGTGDYWELEKVASSFKLKRIEFEEGLFPIITSYIKSGLKPRSFNYFYDQIVISGFVGSSDCSLSIPSENLKELNTPPSETLNLQRDIMTVNSGGVFAAEPNLFRSFPVNDPSGFFWVHNEDILATAGIGYELLFFGSKNLYKIQGFGTQGTIPKRIKLSEVPSVSTRGFCYFDRFVFFVGIDGCYITDGNSVSKVSFEMDPLWFGREEPQTTRYVEQRIQKGPYPFHVNRRRLSEVCCINDYYRQQVMVCLPANDSQTNNMVWVYNYADFLEGAGSGKWSIWGSDEEPTYTGTSLDSNPFTGSPPTRNNPAASPTQSNTTYNVFHWCASTELVDNGEQRIFFGNDRGLIYEYGVSREDWRDVAQYLPDGTVRIGADQSVNFPVVISLGRVGRADSDGRIICTDVAVRRKQLSKNYEDSDTVTKLIAVVRSEGEGLKHFDVSETDVEFSDTILNAQQGVSENTKSVLNTMVLGASPTGSNAPLMNSEYFEAYARVNVPDEEGRAAYVDLYSMPTDEPHRLQISEVRVHANIKGGSQREQS